MSTKDELKESLFGARREPSRTLELKVLDQLAALQPTDQDEFDEFESAVAKRKADHAARMRFSASGTIVVPARESR